jgi:adenylate cyclase
MSGNEKTLSVLFADVVGCNRMHEKLGKTEALYAIERCAKRVQRAVEGWRGRIAKNMGDELMALFNSADDALQAAIEIQQRVTDLPPVSGIKLAIRAGIRHGPVNEEAGEICGACVDQAVSLARLAKAEQTLIDSQTLGVLSPSLQLSTRLLDPMSMNGMRGTMQIFEVQWKTSEQRPALPVEILPSASPSATRQDRVRLAVRYADAVIMLSDTTPVLSIGRDATCNLEIRDQRASRNHARIERRGEKFVLVDASTNGTFLTVAGESERFLLREEAVLRNKGLICFAAPAQSPDADIAEFEYIE